MIRVRLAGPPRPAALAPVAGPMRRALLLSACIAVAACTTAGGTVDRPAGVAPPPSTLPIIGTRPSAATIEVPTPARGDDLPGAASGPAPAALPSTPTGAGTDTANAAPTPPIERPIEPPSTADASVAAPATPAVTRDLPATGIATVYHHRFHGRRTSSGARYDHHGLSAAHRTLPMGAHVRVTALHSGRSVVVTINDRGPWIRDRLIDLSSAAAKQLGMHRPGTMRVRIEAADAVPRSPGHAAAHGTRGVR